MDTAPLALTMGEPAGIGGDIALAAWAHLHDAGPTFFMIDDPVRLKALAARIGLAVPVIAIDTPAAAARHFKDGLPVLALDERVDARPGTLDPAHAAAVLRSIDLAADFARDGSAAAIVTNPIHKRTLYEAGLKHPGHTEYLADRCGVADPVMMLSIEGLRVIPLTIHIPLREVAAHLNRELIVGRARIVAQSLRQDFGVASPRIAVAGLNPHAGEEGTLGREEIDIIAPAVQLLQREGIDAAGPFPADSLFHAEARSRYDAALCMYHDQALIPLKTLDFWSGVNTTLGLPIVRTSPDHGTALELAGTGAANPMSLIAALRLAAEIAARRARNR